jgi:hypothetical protein
VDDSPGCRYAPFGSKLLYVGALVLACQFCPLLVRDNESFSLKLRHKMWLLRAFLFSRSRFYLDEP